MLDGLGLAETTPGPLVLVMEFVGFLAGFGAGGVVMGIAAALVTLWATLRALLPLGLRRRPLRRTPTPRAALRGRDPRA